MQASESQPWWSRPGLEVRDGRLEIAGRDAASIAGELGTPRFVYEAQVAGGGAESLVLRGTQDLSGQLAALGAIVSFLGGGAMLLMANARIGRWATMAAGVGAVFLLAFSAAGLFRADAALQSAGAAGSAGDGTAFGAYVSALGGVIATAAVMLGVVRDRETAETRGWS